MTSKIEDQDSSSEHWASFKEAGTMHGLQFLLLIYKIFGRNVFSFIVYPISIYFVVFRKPAREASLEFLNNHYEFRPSSWDKHPSIMNSVIHFKQFAEAILDKLLAWVTEVKEEDFIVEDYSLIDEVMNDPRGQLVIGSHFGNLEFCRGFMSRYKNKIINVLVYDKHSANFVQMMNKLNPSSRLNVYQVDEFTVETMLHLKGKTDKGEWVFIAGDRIPLEGIQHTVKVNFLKKEALLPIGGYILAKALECPVKFMFAYRRDDKGKNKIFFSLYKLADKISFTRNDRKEKIQMYAQNFMNELERHCLKAPYQWFNFYKFWSMPNIKV